MSSMRTRPRVSGCLLLSAVCLSSIASAQTNWQRTYGGQDDDVGYSVQQTTDGGFIVAGSTASYGAGELDVYLIKTNARGDTLWTRTYGGADYDLGLSVQQTTDDGFVIAGYTGPGFPGGMDIYLIKTDAQGDTLWTRTYGGTSGEVGYSVRQTADGGYIIAGSTQTPDYGDDDVYLIRTNAVGDTLWTRTYGGENHDEAFSVAQTSEGGYIVAGTSNSFGGEDVYLLKTDASGDTLWTRTYRGKHRAGGTSVQQTADSGYIIAGYTVSPVPPTPEGVDVYVVKTNASGDTLWTRTYGRTDWDRGDAVQQTADGGYIIAGAIETDGPTRIDVYLIKINAGGDTLWTRTYGGSDRDQGLSVRQTADGGYIVTGYNRSLGTGDRDVYLIRTNADPDVGPVAILSPPGIADSGSAYVPSVVVRNFGLSRAVFPVTLSIGAGYVQMVQETLASEHADTVVFPAWTADPVGPLEVTCFTSLPGDVNPANDTIRDTIQVLPPPFHDVGAVAIVSPSGSVRAGDTVVPQARIRNFGNRSERFFDVRFRIGANYNEKVNVADALPADSAVELVFPPWVAAAGDWAVSCSTMLASDVDRANDKVRSSVLVFPQSLSIEPDQSGRLEAGRSNTYRFHALIQGDTGAVVEVARPSAPTGWSARLCDATGANDLTDTDGDGIPDIGYVAPGESGWFALDVTAPSGTQGDTASLGQEAFLVAGHVGGRPDIADTAVLNLTLLPAFSVHNFPNPFTDHTAFVVGLPDEGKVNLSIYTRTGERVCRVMENRDMPAGVHLIRWDGVNDNGRRIAPGTYEYLLDYVHAGKTDRIRKRLVLTRQ